MGANSHNSVQTAPDHTVLIVDDTPQSLTILGELLNPLYRVKAAISGEQALRIVNLQPYPDLILLDVMMPEMDGYAVLKQLRASSVTRDIPVIFLTAMNSSEDEALGLELGAVDYITKPFNPAIVLARVHTQLELKLARDRLANSNKWLENEVERRMTENMLIQNLGVRALACLAEARDNETGHHIVRTQNYVEILALHLRQHKRFQQALSGKRLEMIVKAAPLHDIGKIGIPDGILLKPSRLTEDEFDIIKTHPVIGADAITKAMEQTLAGADQHAATLADSAFAFLLIAREISLSHHEKWDGSGYPQGLAGDAIPVAARLRKADGFGNQIDQFVITERIGLDDSVHLDGQMKRIAHFKLRRCHGKHTRVWQMQCDLIAGLIKRCCHREFYWKDKFQMTNIHLRITTRNALIIN
jgi:Response regulator containing a CheY-like receiver domain and an HD-GYP domain